MSSGAISRTSNTRRYRPAPKHTTPRSPIAKLAPRSMSVVQGRTRLPNMGSMYGNCDTYSTENATR